jgi:hypothetical protein
MLAAVRARSTTLIGLETQHPGGVVAVRIEGMLQDFATLVTGVDNHDEPGVVAVDLELAPQEPGTVVAGQLECDGNRNLTVLGAYTEGPVGTWQLPDTEACLNVARALLARRRLANILAILSRR